MAPWTAHGGMIRVRLHLRPAWETRPGTQITMHEDSTVAGTAVVLEVRPPAQRRLPDDPPGNEPSTKGCR